MAESLQSRLNVNFTRARTPMTRLFTGCELVTRELVEELTLDTHSNPACFQFLS